MSVSAHRAPPSGQARGHASPRHALVEKTNRIDFAVNRHFPNEGRNLGHRQLKFCAALANAHPCLSQSLAGLASALSRAVSTRTFRILGPATVGQPLVWSAPRRVDVQRSLKLGLYRLHCTSRFPT